MSARSRPLRFVRMFVVERLTASARPAYTQFSASTLCADVRTRAPGRLSKTSVHAVLGLSALCGCSYSNAYRILVDGSNQLLQRSSRRISSGDNREIDAITPNKYYMADGVQPEQKRDIIDFYTRTDESEKTRAEGPTAYIYIYLFPYFSVLYHGL